MPDLEAGRFNYADRHLVQQVVADALHHALAHLNDPSGSVEVIVRVTPPQLDEWEKIRRTIAEALRD